MVQKAVVVEPQQQRSDHGFSFVVAEAADHAVGAAVVLDLLHAGALARLVGQIAALGDDAVETRADAFQPAFRIAELRRRRRQPDALGAPAIPAEKAFQRGTPFLERATSQQRAIGIDQEIENDQQGRGFLGESLHAARRGMNSLQQRVEGECAVGRNDDFGVEDELLRLERADRRDQLRKISRHRPARFRPHSAFPAVAKAKAAKACPLRPVLPLRPDRDRIDRQCFHRGVGRTSGRLDLAGRIGSRLCRFGGHGLHRQPQVAHELAVLALLVGLVLDAQQVGGMDGDQCRGAVRQPVNLAPHLRDRHHAIEHAARGGRPHRHDRGRLHDRAFLLEPPPAALDLVGIRTLVQAPLAAHLEFEMLDRVGDESIAARNAGLFERLIEDPPGRTHERLAGEVFLVAGLLADQHEPGAGAPFPRNDLGGELVERAARAFGFCLAQRRQRPWTVTGFLFDGHDRRSADVGPPMAARETIRTPTFGSLARRNASLWSRPAKRIAVVAAVRNKADFRRVQLSMARHSRERTNGLEAALAIHLGIYCAVAACFALGLYALLQPARYTNPGLSAYKAPPAMVVTYLPSIRNADTRSIVAAEAEAAKAQVAKAAMARSGTAKPETTKPETAAQEARAETAKRQRAASARRERREPWTRYAEQPMFGGSRPWF